MVEARVQRRLAAIMAADVVGYSRLMGEDEAGTLAALKKDAEKKGDQYWKPVNEDPNSAKVRRACPPGSASRPEPGGRGGYRPARGRTRSLAPQWCLNPSLDVTVPDMTR